GDDARRCGALRPRPLRHRVPPQPAPVRRDDRRRHAVQQDGARAAQGLRADARAALGDLDGLVRERRRLLPLLVLGRARLRPHRPGRHLRARLPADRRGAALRHPAAPEQDLAHEHDRPLMPSTPDALADALRTTLGDAVPDVAVAFGEVTVVVPHERLLETMRQLRDAQAFRFDMLIDVCGVDYASYANLPREGPRFA